MREGGGLGGWRNGREEPAQHSPPRPVFVPAPFIAAAARLLLAFILANALLPLAAAGAVADPFLLQRDQKLYMFYETKSTEQQKGQIGVAVSSDGGMTFQHQAVVLNLAWHLSYPFVFEHNGQVRPLQLRMSCTGAAVLG